jgi:uncharacterized protein (DUF1778 family)
MKTERMELRLSPEEKQAFQLAADIAGAPLGAWMRERLRKAATVELESMGRSIPFLERLKRSE